MRGPPASKAEQRRLTSTVHALDHTSRLAEIAGEARGLQTPSDGTDEARAAALCGRAMRSAMAAVNDIARESALSGCATPIDALEPPSAGAPLETLEDCARQLGQLAQGHRGPTLDKVGTGEITADQAMARIETVRRLDALSRHAWRAVAHLLGKGVG